MKKIYTAILLSILCTVTAFAQNSPDRILLRESTGNIKGYLAERVDSIFFDKIEGEVKANVEIFSVTEGADPKIELAVKMTPECQAYRIAVLEPKYSAYLENDMYMPSLLENIAPQYYYEDFDQAELSGFDAPFLSDATYTIATVGYDKYGIACGVSKATFHTKKVNTVGNPQVTAKILDIKEKEFTIQFEGNIDCGQYFLCAFDRPNGTLEEQFAMWGPMFGFNSPDEMIVQFSGGGHTGRFVQQWTAMTPGTEYDVWVAIQDTKGNFADRLCVSLKTKGYGDDGVAEVSIKIGDFKRPIQTDNSGKPMYDASGNPVYVVDENGKPVYTQNVTFTPNSSTSFFRDLLIEKNYIPQFTADNISGKGEEALIEYIKSDQPMNPYWNLYAEDSWDWTVNPGTTYVAYAIAQNAAGEWGPVATKEFTTPEASTRAAAKVAPKRVGIEKGTVVGSSGPSLKLAPKAKKEMQLSGK